MSARPEFEDLPRVESRFTAKLPADPEIANERRQVLGAVYSRVAPTPVAAPRTLAWVPEVAALLDLPQAFCESALFAEVMAGNRILPGMDPHATCYGGHQFGNWAGQLGDGRAINLGEIVNGCGERWTLQLKGAGPTPYSRMADGRAVLRSSIREFLCSEAMHHLGIPTTRALSLVGTGESVVRDMFYDGRPEAEPGAVVCRVAPSFTRFGHFQIFTARRDHDTLRQLADYTLETDFPELGPPGKETYLRWFDEVCRRTAELVAQWMRVGFVHGVLNTDNMSVLGLTIDYGPYGWIDDYDPDWTPNTTDAAGRRYAFARQPSVAMWNLAQFGSALHPLVGDLEPLQAIVDEFPGRFSERWNAMTAAKLGLDALVPGEDDALVGELHTLLAAHETDMTIFYRRLAHLATADAASIDDESLIATVADAFYSPPPTEHRQRLAAWLRAYAVRASRDGLSDAERRERMDRVNPKYVLRNYLAQLAIDRATAGDLSLVHELLDLVRRPYDEQPERDEYFARRPDWARHRAGCSMLSCSS
jgi:uncharacterized protein YdiU (UPF0061 family)